MTISIALSQSRSYFSVSHTRFTPSWNYTRSLSSRSRIKKHNNNNSFSLLLQCPVWTVHERNRHRQSAKHRRTRTPARRRTTGNERLVEECWRSWSRGAVRRISGLWSQRMNSGLWEKIFPRTRSWVSGLSRRVSYLNFNLVLIKVGDITPLNGHHLL